MLEHDRINIENKSEFGKKKFKDFIMSHDISHEVKNSDQTYLFITLQSAPPPKPPG